MAGVSRARVMLLRADLPDGTSVGSGTLIGPRLVLTAAHVVFDDDGAPDPGLRWGVRLVVGPGGQGRTRLARALARQRAGAPDGAGGVWVSGLLEPDPRRRPAVRGAETLAVQEMGCERIEGTRGGVAYGCRCSAHGG